MFANLRKRGECPWLRPDAKCQLSVVYEDGKPVRLDTVVISHQTTEEGADKEHYERIERIAKNYLDRTGLLDEKTKFYINPTGKFVIGGPCGDSGLTGRKIIVDTYGGMAARGGGAFSGKDPSKVDRSAAYYARYATNEGLERMLASGKVFDFRPYALIEDLGLTRPHGWSYEETAAYGHFGRAAFPWERLDKVDKLKKWFGK